MGNNEEWVEWGHTNPPRWKTPSNLTVGRAIIAILAMFALVFLVAMIGVLLLTLVVACIAVPPLGVAVLTAGNS